MKVGVVGGLRALMIDYFETV